MYATLLTHYPNHQSLNQTQPKTNLNTQQPNKRINYSTNTIQIKHQTNPKTLKLNNKLTNRNQSKQTHIQPTKT